MRKVGHAWLGVALTAAAAMPQDNPGSAERPWRTPEAQTADTNVASGKAEAEAPARPRPPVRVILPSPYSGPR